MIFSQEIPRVANVYFYNSSFGEEDQLTKEALQDRSRPLTFITHGFGGDGSVKWIKVCSSLKYSSSTSESLKSPTIILFSFSHMKINICLCMVFTKKLLNYLFDCDEAWPDYRMELLLDQRKIRWDELKSDHFHRLLYLVKLCVQGVP